MMKNKISAFVLTVFYILSTVQPIFAQTNTITISNAEDFNKFSKKCVLDEWSHGKIVNLVDDIDFSKCDFLPVATFGGTFNGNGHTLSGIKFTKKGSHYGVFRYLQNGGKISELNVCGKFVPGGSKNYIGGIVGENDGTIENSSFDGNIKGENIIGGIVGNNSSNGKITSCTASGNIIGENSTGGIVGENNGYINNCTNNASVNTVYEEKKKNLSDFETDKGSLIDNYKNKEEENIEESSLGHTDTGGIAGYSSGIIKGSVNNGEIGYTHVGYNIGGIAGRQSGYVLGCRNNGIVCGRKDVGGIVGQAEPCILLTASESTLKNLHSELVNLNTLVNNFITDNGDIENKTEDCLNGISNRTNDAKTNVETLLDCGMDFVNDNIGEINSQAAILTNSLEKLSPVFENLESCCSDLSAALDGIGDTIDTVKIYAPNLSDEMDDISAAVSEIEKSEKFIQKAISSLERAEINLEDAITYQNTSSVKRAIYYLSQAIKDVAKSKQSINSSLKEIEDILTSKPEDFEKIGINAKKTAENLKSIRENTNTIISSLGTISDSLDTIVINSDIDFSEFRTAAKNISSSIGYLGDAIHYVSAGFVDLSAGVDNLYDAVSEYADDISEELNSSLNSLSENFESLSYVSDDMEKAITETKKIFEDLSNEDRIKFVDLDDNFKKAGENIFDSLSGISDELKVLKNIVSNEKSKISENLTTLVDQFNLVMNLLVDDLQEIKSDAENITAIFTDASEEDIENTKQGKIADCCNFAQISADRNTGGIAGALAIEYSKDPEDEIEKPNTLNFTYRTKAILQECVNDGEIVGKKDCTGGICGFSEIGTIYKCENYADVSATDGNYVGGIAGKSESSIRKNYSKSTITGKRYVGGIAGKAKRLSENYSIVNVPGEENVGAVCGDFEDINGLYQNFYISDETGAADGISYKSKAEPITYEKLKTLSHIPARFISFCVTFVADGKTVETRDVKYGEDIKKIKYPAIPEKKGHFGNWITPDAETVTENIEIICEYEPYITVLSSEEKNENGKLALALCEGNFTDKAVLHITKSSETPPTDNGCVYRITVSGSDIKDTDSVVFRILNPDKSKVKALQLTNGKWEKITTENKGKYVMLQGTGADNIICLTYEKTSSTGIFFIIAAFALLCAAVFISTKFDFKKFKRR